MVLLRVITDLDLKPRRSLPPSKDLEAVPAVRIFKFEWYFRKIGKPYFPRGTAEKRLDLKSLKRQTKAEELRAPQPFFTENKVFLFSENTIQI